MQGRNGVKGPLPREGGFGLRTGDRGGNTAEGAWNLGRPASCVQTTRKNRGLPEPQTSISFPEIRCPGLGKGRKEELCVFVGILRHFRIFNEDIKSLV